MNDKSILIITGIVVSSIFFLMIKFNRYYEKKILPKETEVFQKLYWETEKKKSQMGAYNIPFHNGRIISKEHNKEELYKFGVVLGLVCILLGIF
ncbi:hypothetical protein [Clostridium perfringens]|uniref:hypothetical protein n=1 Tax=Clostridium perfringens TaxID=1502 RepID=UPI003F4445DE